jgi:FkbM family methyltransferase
MNEMVLQGESYPALDQTLDVQVVLDVGANVGASTVWFSHLFPGAVIHAFEPAPAPFRLLVRNTSELAGVHCHRFGLFSEDGTATLHDGSMDSGMASIAPNPLTLKQGQPVELRSIAGWLDDTGTTRVDVIKIDTEGCELPILRGLRGRLASIALVYVEYHSESDRHGIDELLAPSHLLARGRALRPHLGELAYVAREVFEADDAALDTEIRLPDHLR